jgi:hypothetical protein
MNFEDIKSIEDLEIVSREIIWQNFEKLTAIIFEKKDIQIKINTIKTISKKRRQNDEITKRGNQTK